MRSDIHQFKRAINRDNCEMSPAAGFNIIRALQIRNEFNLGAGAQGANVCLEGGLRDQEQDGEGKCLPGVSFE